LTDAKGPFGNVSEAPKANINQESDKTKSPSDFMGKQQKKSFSSMDRSNPFKDKESGEERMYFN